MNRSVIQPMSLPEMLHARNAEHRPCVSIVQAIRDAGRRQDAVPLDRIDEVVQVLVKRSSLTGFIRAFDHHVPTSASERETLPQVGLGHGNRPRATHWNALAPQAVRSQKVEELV